VEGGFKLGSKKGVLSKRKGEVGTRRLRNLEGWAKGYLAKGNFIRKLGFT